MCLMLTCFNSCGGYMAYSSRFQSLPLSAYIFLRIEIFLGVVKIRAGLSCILQYTTVHK